MSVKRFILGVILVFLFLVSCTQIEENEKEILKCTPRWKCSTSTSLAYLDEKCDWVNETPCKFGCINHSCQICSVGFRCKDNNTLAYLNEDCSWNQTKNCADGCLNGSCLIFEKGIVTEPEEAVNETVEEIVKEGVSVKGIYTLNYGEKIWLKINDVKYNLSIHNLDFNQVKIAVNGLKGDWQAKNNSFVLVNGINMTVNEIYFQPYAEGMKMIEFVLE